MRIEDVRAFPVKVPEAEFWGGGGADALAGARPFESDYVLQPGWIGLYSSHIESCLVRIETDSGLVGYGEGQTPIGPEVTAAAVTHVLRPLLIGEDPARVGVLRRKMYEALLPRGHFTGYVLDAIAAADTALWDLKGKALQRPVHDLLGGGFRTRIPAYVSGLAGATVEEQAVAGREYLDRGFWAIKLYLTEGFDKDVTRIRGLRDALGRDATLMADLLWAYDPPTALRMGRVLEALDGAWLEAPIHPEDLDGHAELARLLTVPVAGGETDRTRYQFRRQFERRSLDIAQPDAGRCGITEGKAIAELAETYNVPVTMHTGMATAVLIAASLHLGASIPDCRYQEFQPRIHAVGNRFITSPLVCEGGYYQVPTGPGLGIEVDENVLQKYTVAT